jgi:serine/threonine protein kinase
MFRRQHGNHLLDAVAYSAAGSSNHSMPMPPNPYMYDAQMEMTALLGAVPYSHFRYNTACDRTYSILCLFSDQPPNVRQIDFDSLQFQEKLASGHFGQVWRGQLVCVDGPLTVAIKTLKNAYSHEELRRFEDECSLAARLHHANIVQLLGTGHMQNGCAFAVFEYMANGDLHQLVQLRSPYGAETNSLPIRIAEEHRAQMMADHAEFAQIACQIAAGMEYLACAQYVHRDLAARNCLVNDRRIIKIADFGMTRDIYARDYYRDMNKQTPIPVRWMPVEAIDFSRFTEYSDVWSYGVTVWEMYAYGAQPYAGSDNDCVIDLVRDHNRLPLPPVCPQRMYR